MGPLVKFTYRLLAWLTLSTKKKVPVGNPTAISTKHFQFHKWRFSY